MSRVSTVIVDANTHLKTELQKKILTESGIKLNSEGLISTHRNSYPDWWDTTITIYNKFEDPQTRVITWYATTLTNCFWKYTGDKVTIGETVLSTDDTVCRIPEDENFKEKYDWDSTPNDSMSDYFTLAVGDIIVKGEVDEEIDEYTSGKRSSDFLKKHKKLRDCITIETMSINTGDARGSRHYYVKGV